MSYTENDFRNAKFAEHADGTLAMRTFKGDYRKWETTADIFSDYEMAAGEWAPVAPKPTLKQSEYEMFTREANGHFKAGFDGALILFEIPVIPTPEPPTWVKLAEDIRRIDGAHNLGAGTLAERLVSLGWAKTPGGANDGD